MRMEAVVPPALAVRRRVAVLVDGENITAACADAVLRLAQGLGQVAVRRVYRDAARGGGWAGIAGFRTVHSGDSRGRNAADMALAIDAVAMALRGQADAFVLVSSDGDFTGLALWLRENGFAVTGVGEAKAPAGFRAACDSFRIVEAARAAPEATPAPAAPQAPPGTGTGIGPATAPEVLLARVDKVLGAQQGEGWLRIVSLGHVMARAGVRISETPHRTWRALLAARPERYELDPKGPDARVRLRRRTP